MSCVDATCKAFRVAWLETSEHGPASAAAHDSCPACLAWTRSTAAQLRLFAGLARVGVPDELTARVAREVAGDRSERLGRVLASCTRLAAPQCLEETLFPGAPADGAQDAAAVRGDGERGERAARILRTLDLPPAPAVLERLVDEELHAPAAHRTGRFSGDLERLRAPDVLERRLSAGLRRSSLVRLFAGPVATLAAAALVVWVAVRSGQEPAAREYSFRVVRAADVAELDPLARELAEALSGGASSALPLADRRGDGREAR